MASMKRAQALFREWGPRLNAHDWIGAARACHAAHFEARKCRDVRAPRLADKAFHLCNSLALDILESPEDKVDHDEARAIRKALRWWPNNPDWRRLQNLLMLRATYQIDARDRKWSADYATAHPEKAAELADLEAHFLP